ncbi:MAG: M61 family peptidase [Leptospira sp.]|nr:M61 family peptidase [Leptospira sp.]
MAKEQTSPIFPNIQESNQSQLQFTVSILDLEKHYYSVELFIQSNKPDITLVLPNWTPGSYMIRDYSTHLHKLTAKNSITDEPLKIDEQDLNTWNIPNPSGSILVHYIIYAFEDYTVRTNYLNDEFGFISPPALFLFPKGELNCPVSVKFETSEIFPNVYSSLKRFNQSNSFYANDFDELYDSPFHLSKMNSVFFEVGQTLHELVVEGDVTFEFKQKLADDLKKITAVQMEWMNDSPNLYYLFVLNLSLPAYGGLEHRASSINFFNPELISDEKEYTKLLELLSHEYFHLWNVKRIRPIQLGPFDYERPNLTKELWIAEGVTSFYDNYFLLSSGFLSPDEYLKRLESDIFSLEESTGEDWMSLEESSLTAWTKYYKRNANSQNVTVSYYTKGAILSLCINLFLLKESPTKKTLRHVFQKLNSVFVYEKKRGYTKQEFFDTVQSVTGINIYTEFSSYIEKPERIPVENYLGNIGLKIVKSDPIGELGFRTKEKGGNLFVQRLIHSRSGANVTLHLEDEIIAINGKRVNQNFMNKFEKQILPKESYHLTIARNGKIKEYMMKAEENFQIKKLAFLESKSEETKENRDRFFSGLI